MERKVCSKCKEEKEVCEFNKDKSRKDGLRSECKSCQKKQRSLTYYLTDEIKERHRERQKKYYYNNIDKIQGRQKNYQNNRYKNDPDFKISKNIRRRILFFLQSNNIYKNNKTFEIIGCTPQQLKEHIESQFRDNMSWENYGYYGWHIDHKIPLSSAKTEEEVYKLCHYTNLQPLWAEDNLKKSNKII
jgi:hypothetical protein